MLEQDSTSEENCNLRSAEAGHSSNKCLSSLNAPVLHKLQTRLARGRINGGPPQLGYDETPCKTSESSAIWHFPLVIPNKMGKLYSGAPKPAVLCAKFEPSRWGQSGILRQAFKARKPVPQEKSPGAD